MCVCVCVCVCACACVRVRVRVRVCVCVFKWQNNDSLILPESKSFQRSLACDSGCIVFMSVSYSEIVSLLLLHAFIFP